MEYTKDFEKWNSKKKIFDKSRETFAQQREIWWCALGVNIGSEVDGKNETFERPVLILHAYNINTALILPITSREKNDRFHIIISVKKKSQSVMLTQSRVISTKRLIRKIATLEEVDFTKVHSQFVKHLAIKTKSH
jgi:mRNA interferase MazF